MGFHCFYVDFSDKKTDDKYLQQQVDKDTNCVGKIRKSA